MALATYRRLALKWQPSHREDRVFTVFATVLVLVMLALGFYLSSIEVPEKPRQERAAVPERVAKFINQQEKPKPKPPEPKPQPKPPEPKTEPVERAEPPKIVRERPKPQQKPLTETQQKAREKASQSGLMALSSELNDLIDTADVSEQVKGSIKKTGDAQVASRPDADILTSGATDGSGGVDSSKYATKAGTTELGSEEVAAARAALAASDEAFSNTRDDGDAGGTGRARSEEEITLVFDRHKSQLQSIYNRARRSNPSLQGKLVLEITILPDGSVSDAKVLSTELTDQALVARLLARIRQFQFGAKDVATATVSYPIEFLPY